MVAKPVFTSRARSISVARTSHGWSFSSKSKVKRHAVTIARCGLCFDADNVLPAVLRHAGLLEVAPEVEKWILERQALAAEGREHVELRAAAIVCCEAILRRYVRACLLVWCSRSASQRRACATLARRYLWTCAC